MKERHAEQGSARHTVAGLEGSHEGTAMRIMMFSEEVLLAGNTRARSNILLYFLNFAFFLIFRFICFVLINIEVIIELGASYDRK